jgi:hypothetical protein
VAVDLFAAAGYRGRLVALGCHTIAEIFYDGSWHYFDADLFGNGETVAFEDGTIPSVVQLSRRPFLIDSLAAFWAPDATNEPRACRGDCKSDYRYQCASYFYFSKKTYALSHTQPCYFEKTATPEQERGTRNYGWYIYTTVPDPDRWLWDMPVRLIPSAPIFSDIFVDHSSPTEIKTKLSWHLPSASSGRFHVFVSTHTRGWNYSAHSLPEHLASFKSSNKPWRPYMYDARFTVPPSDVLLQTVYGTSTDLSLPRGPRYFITVMPFEPHDEMVHKKIYPMSEEVWIGSKRKVPEQK